jgi:hypothetical protein
MNMTKIASIATNDPDRDPTPRVVLRRVREGGFYVWLTPEGARVADGKSPAGADWALRQVYGSPVWDLQFDYRDAR